MHTLGEPGFLTAEDISRESFLASTRLQLVPAILASQALGIENRVLAIRSERPEFLERLHKPDLCIVGKISHPDRSRRESLAMANIAALTRLRRRGTRIISIYSDNLVATEDTARKEFGYDLLNLSDTVVVPSRGMAEVVVAVNGRTKPLTVIEDPWQVSEAPFSAMKEGDPVRLAWFGHQSNARYMAECVSDVIECAKTLQQYLHLTCLTSAEGLQILYDRFSSIEDESRVTIKLIQWNEKEQPDQLSRLLRHAHICLLPSDISDPKKKGASHNRAVDAIRAGCIAIGSPIPSYKEMEDVMIVGDNIREMLSATITNYERIIENIQSKRKATLERFSPERNHHMWMKLISNELSHGWAEAQPKTDR